ncbi:MAG: lamin tail domain-containing protein, partial [Planctomycetales bacterium]|nr:lamin tail domain-containing protein [Planctomycetales bacterium]
IAVAPPVVQGTALVAADANWAYLDDGSVPTTTAGSDWRINDPGWTKSGRSQLGYGDGDERTVVSYVDTDPSQSGTQKNITTYFRHAFNVTGAEDYTSLTLRLLRDDGAVVYLNGVEIVRTNMPSGTITSTTTANSAVGGGEEDQFFEYDVPPNLLVEGANVIAVEIHQANDTSSDISFDLELDAVVGAPVTFSGIDLNEGVNRLGVEAFDAQGKLLDSTHVDVWYDAGPETVVAGGVVTSDLHWTVAGGPYVVTSDLTIAGGTLTIDPGVTVFFNPNVDLIISGAGRIVAEGTADEHIRLSHNPRLGTGNWAGVTLLNTASDNRFTYVDLQRGDSAGQALLVQHGKAVFDHVEWLDVNNQILDLVHPILEVRNSILPSISGNETIHLLGLDQNESLTFDGNIIGFNASGDDAVDLGHNTLTPGPVVFRNNVFMGGYDDGVDTDGFGVLLENNVFQNFHLGTSRATTSNAVSTGHVTVGGTVVSSDLILRGNIFINNDHHLLLKDFSQAVVINNTFVDAAIGGIHFTEPNGSSVIGPGLAAELDGNIFYGPNVALLDIDPTTQLTVNRSLLPSQFHALGVGNIDADPLFTNVAVNDLSLTQFSPARGTGPDGLDMGAVQTPDWTPATAANLRITEINYHPLAGDKAGGEVGADANLFEFIELKNTSDEIIDLTDAYFSQGVDFAFPWRANLAPGEVAVLVKNADVFRSRYGEAPRILGEYAGRLSNDGEKVELRDATGASIASFTYNDAVDWPQGADGLGYTLEVVDLGGDYSAPATYRDSLVLGGTPGSAEFTSTPGDFNGNGRADGFDFLAWQRGFGLTNALPSQGDADGDADVDAQDLQIWETAWQSSPATTFASSSAAAAQSLALTSESDLQTIAAAVDAAFADAALPLRQRSAPRRGFRIS